MIARHVKIGDQVIDLGARVDDTLSIAGEAADAKKVGDEIAAASNFVELSDTQPTDPHNRIWITDGDEVEIPTMEDMEIKTEKVQINYMGDKSFKVKGEGADLTYKQIRDCLMDSPNFVLMVHGNREHRCTMIDDASNPRQMRFVAPILSDGVLKTQSIYVTSNDGVSITSVSVTNINSENQSNKVQEITEQIKGSTGQYPSVKAVYDHVEDKTAELVKNTDYATASTAGVVKAPPANSGLIIDNTTGQIIGEANSTNYYKTGAGSRYIITKGTLENIKDDFVKRGLTENQIEFSDDEKEAARELIGAASEEELNQKTKKTRIDFDGSKFQIGSKILNYKELHDTHLNDPDFAFVVYGDRAYLLSYDQADASAMREMRFQSVLAVTDSNGISNVKTSGIYVTSTDGINITSVKITDINSENKSYKVNEITDDNKDSTVMYPSVKAVANVESRLSTHYTRLEQKVGEVPDGQNLADNVSQLSESIDEISNIVIGASHVDVTWEQGGVSSAGESGTLKTIRTNFIPVSSFNKLKIEFPPSIGNVRAVGYRTKDVTSGYISYQPIANGTVFENNYGYVYIRFRADHADSSEILPSEGKLITITPIGNDDLVSKVRELAGNVSSNTVDITTNTENIAKNTADILAIKAEPITYEYSGVDDLINASYAIKDTGEITTHSAYARTDYIPIPNTYTNIVHNFPFSNTGNDGYAIYDKDKQFIIGGKDKRISVLDGYAYIVIDYKKDVGGAVSVEITKEKKQEKGLEDDVKSIETRINVREDVVIPTLISGIYLIADTGAEGSQSSYHSTDYIEVPEHLSGIVHNFYNSSSGTDGICFYDENKVFISGSGKKNTDRFENYITRIPSNAKYVRFSSRTNYEESGVARWYQFIYTDIEQATLFKGKNIVMLGDSIIGNFNGDNSIPNYLHMLTGANCYNCGFGGSTMGTDTKEPIYASLEAFNGFKVIEAIVTGDFSALRSAIASDTGSLKDYYSSHVDTLESLDFNNVDIITLSYGTNDYGVSVTIEDDANNKKDTNTFGGAYRTALERLWSAYPHIKVVICSPIWRGMSVSGSVVSADGDETFRIAYLKDYVAKCKEIAEEYHVPYLDMYNTNFNKFTWTKYFSGTDATHPDGRGRLVMAKRYAWFLKQI